MYNNVLCINATSQKMNDKIKTELIFMNRYIQNLHVYHMIHLMKKYGYLENGQRETWFK